MTAPDEKRKPRPPAARPRSMGNILIMLSLLLLGAALAVSATPNNTPVETPESKIAPETPVADIAPPRPANIQSSLDLPQPATSPTPTPAEPVSPSATEEPVVEPTPTLPKPPPNHIQIPSVGIDTPIVEVGYEVTTIGTQQVMEWEVADFAAGHHNPSANPGENGNIVVTGHNDWNGEVFRTLEHVELGDEVILKTPEGEHRYVIQEIHFRREVGVPLEERIATGAFLNPMPEERLTLITCWPYQINDHRIIVVAKPID